jgi:hypothetical protein
MHCTVPGCSTGCRVFARKPADLTGTAETKRIDNTGMEFHDIHFEIIPMDQPNQGFPGETPSLKPLV